MKTLIEEFVDLVAQAKDTKIVPFEAMQWEQEHQSFFHEWEEMLLDLDPMFGLYMQVLQALMMTSQFLLAEERLVKADKLIRRLEKRYAIGTPESGVLESYFNYWMLFDLPVVDTGETLGQVALAVMAAVEKLSPDFEFLANKSIQSRLGFYEYLGLKDELLILKELPFGDPIHVVSTVHYTGEPGEIWLARPLPFLGNSQNWVLGTTPYIIKNITPQMCKSFFSRRGISSHYVDAASKLHRYMKFPTRPDFWMRYFHQACMGMKGECIFLDGLPR